MQTLSPLVAGATAGLIAEVIVADGGSRDATEEVADIAGCRFLRRRGAGRRAAGRGRGACAHAWLMFLRPGTVPEAGWLEAVEDFDARRWEGGGFLDRTSRSMWDFFGARVRPEQGLLISAKAYRGAGGHPPIEDAEAALLRKLGRIALLAATARAPLK